MTQRIQVRRGTAAAATAANPILAAGEFGFETDTGKVKIGDGVTAWNSLVYQPSATHGHAAAAVTYAGSTNLAATDVEAALDELDAEKEPLHRIAEVVLAADAASIDFTSIPATFRHLEIEFTLRTTRASTSVDTLVVALNNDTSDANYDLQYYRATGATVSAARVNGTTGSRGIALLAPDLATANIAGAGRIQIGHYAGGLRKALRCVSHEPSTPYIEQRGCHWNNTAAINRITLTGLFGSLKAGGVATLWGRK